MKSFPRKLIPRNRIHFAEYLQKRQLAILRDEVYEYMLSERTDGWDIPKDIDLKLIDKLREELEDLGWKTRVAFANSTLFIFQEGEEPKIPEGLKELF